MGVVSSAKPKGFHALTAPATRCSSDSLSRRRVSLRRASEFVFCFVFSCFFSMVRSFLGQVLIAVDRGRVLSETDRYANPSSTGHSLQHRILEPPKGLFVKSE